MMTPPMYMSAGTKNAATKRKLKSGLGTVASFVHFARPEDGNAHATLLSAAHGRIARISAHRSEMPERVMRIFSREPKNFAVCSRKNEMRTHWVGVSSATRWRGVCSAVGESHRDSRHFPPDPRADPRHWRERDAHLPGGLRSRK